MLPLTDADRAEIRRTADTVTMFSKNIYDRLSKPLQNKLIGLARRGVQSWETK